MVTLSVELDQLCIVVLLNCIVVLLNCIVVLLNCIFVLLNVFEQPMTSAHQLSLQVGIFWA